MKKAISISKIIKDYQNFKEFKDKLIEGNKVDLTKEYGFYEIATLKELVRYRAQNPYQFKFACKLVKLKLA